VNGGWHFSFQGGAVRILEKLNSYGHQELNISDVKENLIKNIKELEDIRNTKANFSILERDLPAYLKTFRETHEDWFR
jgi:beta-1,4-mannosyl-glycoprotein beta-1,4-N-acetylglucosaminyltransferase